MKKSTLILGYLFAFIMLAAAIFKHQHWPGSGILIVFGAVLFSFGYGIPLFIEKHKVAEGSYARFIAVWVLVIMIVLPISFMFKMMHWPGSGILYYLSHFILLISIPIVIVHAVKSKDTLKNMNFHNEAILLIVLCAFSLFIGFTTLGKGVLNGFIPINQNVVKEMKYHESKCNEMYADIEAQVTKNNAGKDYLEKAKDVKIASDSLCVFIVSLEIRMIKATGQDNFNIDSLELIQEKANYDIPTKVMIGNNGAGAELKQKITKYKELVSSKTNGRGKEIIKLLFNTDDTKDYDGNIIIWENNLYYHNVLISVLCDLNQIMSNVRLLESETLVYLQAMAANAINHEASKVKEEKKK